MYKYYPIKIKMNTYIKSILGIAFCLLAYQYANAQNKKQEIAVSAASTISLISYGLNNGDAKNKMGYAFDLRHSYYFNDNWSIGLGVEYQSYQSSIDFKNLSGSYTTTDYDNESFQFRYAAQNYNESQKIGKVNIPLTVQYETTTGKYRFYALTGLKVGFTTNATSQTNISTLSTSGYYPQYDAELFDPEFMGFGTFNNIKTTKQDLDTKIVWSTTLESGIKHYLNENHAIYVGLFFDIGLNSIVNSKQKVSKEEVVMYPSGTSPVVLQYNAISNSGYSEKMKLSSFGLKIRYAFQGL